MLLDTLDPIAQALKQHFGHADFRAGQREVVEQALAGLDQLVLMPTGGGKSLTYQLPALLLPGLTVVVSPLIALMHDQVNRLRDNGIAATFINSSTTPEERTRREQAALKGELKLLYVAPERLLSEGFLGLLDRIDERVGLSLLAIDEAHCISEWGHDFRPEYRKIVQVRERYPQLPVLCLTATATERVREDIVRQLALKTPHVHIASFNRPNLYYEVRSKDRRSFAELLDLFGEAPDASAIVYCQSRKSVEQLAERLNENGIRALPYHAGLGAKERSNHQERFICDDVPVLVATVAFGMGIGKPDVRAVVHYDLPRNLEGYYQESGRAGRDGQPAKCLLFFSHGDRAKVEYMIAQKPDASEQRIARQQLNQVVAYAESTICRRRIQLGYFGEVLGGENCGNCDNCLSPVASEERTVDAQKLLSCVARCQERFGMRHIVDVLRGANSQKIQERSHDKLSTYGIGKDRSEDEWLRLGRALLHQGLLTETTDGYSVLKLNPRSWEVLQGRQSVLIAQVASTQKASTTGRQRRTQLREEMQLPAEGEDLFQQLRQLRKRLADEQGVPPYVVFPDATLVAMAQQRPQSEAQFQAIPGVGHRKLEAYFTVFTGAIRTYCEARNLPLAVASPAQPPKARPELEVSSHRRTLELFERGLSLEAIAEERSLKPNTIENHLVELIEAGEDIDIDRLVQPGRRSLIVAAFHRLGLPMKPVKELLGEAYSYGEIRLVRAWLERSDRENSFIEKGAK